MKVLKDEIQKDEEALRDVMKKWQEAMLQVPNIPDMSVPDGKDDSENLEIKTWGEKTKFPFEAKSHVDIMTKLGIVDFERGRKCTVFVGITFKKEERDFHGLSGIMRRTFFLNEVLNHLWFLQLYERVIFTEQDIFRMMLRMSTKHRMRITSLAPQRYPRWGTTLMTLLNVQHFRLSGSRSLHVLGGKQEVMERIQRDLFECMNF